MLDAAKDYLDLDADADGRVTEAEVLQDRAVKFQRLDGNGDGAITLGEVRRALNEAIPSAATERLKQQGIDDLSLLFMGSMDENEDGKVQRFEFERPAQERFRQVDANSDGFVTPGETTFFFSKARF